MDPVNPAETWNILLHFENDIASVLCNGKKSIAFSAVNSRAH
jgi:hypothetical protein